MTVMFTVSFYSDYEIYRTDNAEQLISDVKGAYLNGDDIDFAKTDSECIGTQDTIDVQTALNMSDIVVYLDEID